MLAWCRKSLLEACAGQACKGSPVAGSNDAVPACDCVLCVASVSHGVPTIVKDEIAAAIEELRALLAELRAYKAQLRQCRHQEHQPPPLLSPLLMPQLLQQQQQQQMDHLLKLHFNGHQWTVRVVRTSNKL